MLLFSSVTLGDDICPILGGESTIHHPYLLHHVPGPGLGGSHRCWYHAVNNGGGISGSYFFGEEEVSH